MNTVTLMLNNRNKMKRSLMLLLLDSITPVLGAASTLLFKASPHFMVLYLGFFAGFLLYIGASDILPEAHSDRSSYQLIGLTVLGVIFIYIVTRFA
jgi:ZIP family zinc transporter